MNWIICYVVTLLLLASITGFAAVSATCARARMGQDRFEGFQDQDDRLIDGNVPAGERVRIFGAHFVAAIATPRIGFYAAIGGTVLWGFSKLF